MRLQRAIGPFQIIERRDQFLVRHGRQILSVHNDYRAAEDWAIFRWLGHDFYDEEFIDERSNQFDP